MRLVGEPGRGRVGCAFVVEGRSEVRGSLLGALLGGKKARKTTEREAFGSAGDPAGSSRGIVGPTSRRFEVVRGPCLPPSGDGVAPNHPIEGRRGP